MVDAGEQASSWAGAAAAGVLPSHRDCSRCPPHPAPAPAPAPSRDVEAALLAVDRGCFADGGIPSRFTYQDSPLPIGCDIHVSLGI